MTISIDHAARTFFRRYPRWEDFSHDLAMKRDDKDQEKEVVSQIENLSVLCERERNDLLGQYYATQAGKPGARDDLIGCYDKAYQDRFHKPSGAFPPPDGGIPIGHHTR